METKKISFVFSKNLKKSSILLPKKSTSDAKVELIKCLEGKTIKLVEEKHDKKLPLIIPIMNGNQKTSSALLSLIKRRTVLLDTDKANEVEMNATCEKKIVSNEFVSEAGDLLERRATRELLAGVINNEQVENVNTLILPVVKPEDLPLEGAKESTLDDYNNIPIDQFGFGMLRGMGWVDTETKKNAESIDNLTFVRPKGMGLGADKVLKKKSLLVTPKENEVLKIKIGAYVRILAGKYKDSYGQIEGFDDYAGRVIVKLAIGNHKEAFNEFLCLPVCRQEYIEYGKCINTAKYEEYKKIENKSNKTIVNKGNKDINNTCDPIADTIKVEKNSDIQKDEHNGITNLHSIKSNYERKSHGRSSRSPKHRHHDKYRRHTHIRSNEQKRKNDIYDRRSSSSSSSTTSGSCEQKARNSSHSRRRSSSNCSTTSESRGQKLKKSNHYPRHSSASSKTYKWREQSPSKNSKHRTHKNKKSCDSTTFVKSSSSLNYHRQHRSSKNKSQGYKERHGRSRSKEKK